jgi:DNA repair exonuclease SbcCD nuclease subunit
MFIISDLHIGKNQDTIIVDKPNLLDGVFSELSSRMFDVVSRLEFITEQAVKFKEAIVVAGDIFDTVSPSTKVINIFMQWLTYSLKRGVMVYIMPGNHDSTVDWINTEMFYGMQRVLENLVVCISPGTYSDIDGVRVMMLPHIPREMLVNNPQILSSLKTADVDVFIGHGQIRGGDIDTYDNDCFYEAGKAVELTFDMFPTGSRVVLGHEHAHIEYKRGDVLVVYPGSIAEHNYGESEEEKGYMHILPAVFDWYPYPELKYPYLNMEIDLTNKEFAYTADDLRDLCEGKLIKVIVKAKDALAVNQIQIQRIVGEAGGIVTRFETQLIYAESDTIKISDMFRHDHSKILLEYLEGNKDISKKEIQAIHALGVSFIEGGAE